MKSLYVMMLDILVLESKHFGVCVNRSDEKSLTDYEISFNHCTGDVDIIVSIENNNIKRIIINNGLDQQVLENELLTDLIKDLFIRDNFYNLIKISKCKPNNGGHYHIDDHFNTGYTSHQVLHG